MPVATAIAEAVNQLKSGGIIAYPTESVYGLGCDPNNEQALTNLLRLKNRIPEKGLIVLVADIDQALPFIEPISDSQKRLISQPCERATTWLIPCKESVSPLLRGRFSSLAIRVTTHPIARQICEQFGQPIVSTSCNHSGQRPCREYEEVCRLFKDEVDGIVDGQCEHQQPSRILCINTQQVIR